MASLALVRHQQATRTARGWPQRQETDMLDLLMLGLAAASFALLARYLVACERGVGQ
jgi:hypothetical protein